MYNPSLQLQPTTHPPSIITYPLTHKTPHTWIRPPPTPLPPPTHRRLVTDCGGLPARARAEYGAVAGALLDAPPPRPRPRPRPSTRARTEKGNTNMDIRSNCYRHDTRAKTDTHQRASQRAPNPAGHGSYSPEDRVPNPPTPHAQQDARASRFAVRAKR